MMDDGLVEMMALLSGVTAFGLVGMLEEMKVHMMVGKLDFSQVGPLQYAKTVLIKLS